MESDLNVFYNILHSLHHTNCKVQKVSLVLNKTL